MREPGASPGRSRRCEGRCSPAESHWRRTRTRGREGGGGGCPESEDLPRSSTYRTPRGRRIRGTTSACSRGRDRPRARARGRCPWCDGHRSCRREDAVDLRLGARRRSRRPTRCRHSTQPARSASSTTSSPICRSATTSARSASTRPPGSGWVFKVNGVSPPVGSGPGRTQRRRHRALVLRHIRRHGRPAHARPEGGRRQLLHARLLDDAGKRVGLTGASLHVDGRRVKVSSNGRACVGRHTGVVRAFAVGAVRSNAVK